MKRNRWRNGCILALAGNLLVSGLFGGVGFRDDFDGESLDAAWQVSRGVGGYSLLDNPGHLRYILKGPRAHEGQWYGADLGGWQPSCALWREYSGTDWTLTGKVSYSLAWQDAGAQRQMLTIGFGEHPAELISIDRRVDQWYGVNRLEISHVRDGATQAYDGDSGRFAGDVPVAGRLQATYWYRVVRSGDRVSVAVSPDGIAYRPVLACRIANPATQIQRVCLEANVWTTAGSYADWDFIEVRADTPRPAGQRRRCRMRVGDRSGTRHDRPHIRPGRGQTADIVVEPPLSGEIVVRICTLAGRVIWQRTLTVEDGVESVVAWTCKDDGDRPLPSGVYLVRISGAGIDEAHRVCIVR